MVNAPRIRTEYVGLDPGDELFAHILGHFNVTKAWKLAHDAKCGPYRQPLTRQLYAKIAMMTAVDEDHAAAISPERADEPVLIATLPQVGHLLLDGRHRLTRRLKDGREDFAYFLLDESRTSQCRVERRKIRG